MNRSIRITWLPWMLVVAACAAEPRRAPDATPTWATGTLSDTGFGPVIVGITPLEAQAAAGGLLKLPEVLAAEGCDYASAVGLEGLAFMIENGRVVRVEARAGGIRTAEGAAVGDTEARIQELYAGRVDVLPHKYTEGHYLVITPRNGAIGPVQLIFETDGHVVTQFRSGLVPQVAYVERCG